MDRGPIFYGIFFLYAFTISRLAVDFLYRTMYTVPCMVGTGTVPMRYLQRTSNLHVCTMYTVPCMVGTGTVPMRYLQRTSNFHVWRVGRRAGPLFDCVHYCQTEQKGYRYRYFFNKDLDPDPDGQK
jgi:hypothetical protein